MRQTLRPVAASFLAFGAFWGTWAVAAANIERGLHLSPGGLGLMLSASVGVGGLCAAAAGGIAERWGTGRTLVRSLIAWGTVIVALALVPGRDGFIALFMSAMAAAGLVDMAMNAGAAAGLRDDAAAMVRFHSLFNSGALIGAAVTGGLLRAGVSWRWTWAVVGSGALVLAAASRSSPIPGSRHLTPSEAGSTRGDTAVDRGTPDATGGLTPVLGEGGVDVGVVEAGGLASLLRSFRVVRAEHLGLLACVFATTAMVEGGIDTWGVLYLRTHLAAGVVLGAGAYGVGQIIAASTRAAGAPLIGRLGARHGLVAGALLAGSGLLLEALAHRAAPAAVGLALAAGGISLCWPLVMSVLSGTGPSATALVGAFTASGYLGWVAGPALIGWVADQTGLGSGLVVLGALSVAAALSLALRPARLRPAGAAERRVA